MTPHKSLDQLFSEGGVVDIGGTTHKLNKLSNQDFAEFVTARKNAQCKAFYSTMQGLPPAPQARVISNLLTDAWSDMHMIEEAGTVAGAMWIVGRSLKNAGSKLDSNELSHVDLIDKSTYVLVISGLLSKEALYAIASDMKDDAEKKATAGDTTGDQSSQK